MSFQFSTRSAVIWMVAFVASPAATAREVTIESALLQLIEQVDVPARVSGILSSVSANEGDVVTAGTKLAQLDDKNVKLVYQRAAIELALSAEKAKNHVAIRSAQRSLEFARSENDRVQRASAGLPGSVSQSMIEETKLKLAQSELDLEQAQHEQRLNQLTEKLKKQELALGQHEIELREIVAPLNGVVVEVLRHEGEWVEPGEKVIRIVRVDRLRAEGLIHVEHVTAALKGAAATVAVTVPGQGEMQSTGHVVFVSPEVNPVNGLVRITVEFANPKQVLRPGLRARIIIPSPSLRRPLERTSRTERFRR